jgi:hypothetical protein
MVVRVSRPRVVCLAARAVAAVFALSAWWQFTELARFLR